MSGVFNVPLYGMTRWDLLFSARQLLSAKVLGEEIVAVCNELAEKGGHDRAVATKVLLLLARDKYLDFRSTLCGWISSGEKIGHTFGRQALGMIFDWAEGTPFGDMSGSWERSYEAIAALIRREGSINSQVGTVMHADAQHHPLPDDSVAAVITDPPYYNAVPYADLSDFFYLWLRPHLGQQFPDIFRSPAAPKSEELCEMKGWDPIRYPNKDAAFYENGMRRALEEARRVCRPDGIAVVVFAHKTTAGWETLLAALIDAGWVVTGSWPIDTERAGRLRAMKSAALGSSVHLVCRPRETTAGQVVTNSVGDWRSVLEELPGRIREWLPRLASEGVVGADAIFACLGPALEVFSRYVQVEKVSGERVSLREYLEHVWAVVSREALRMILENAETVGLEADARVTAMWLWTLLAPSGENGKDEAEESEDDLRDESDTANNNGGFGLEFDAARKIAQGLGARLDELQHVVEVKGDKARLLAVSERMRHLFGKTEGAPSAKKAAKKKQMVLFADLEDAADQQGWGEVGAPKAGTTTLDRVHQAMLLFGAGRGEALKRFLVEEGVGKQAQFWKLGQSLSALYPGGSDEKRWVDGILARKKGLGFG
jgi:adenine-specific DNA methylase